MQKDPLISAMVGALLVGSFAILVLGCCYHYQAHQSRIVQAELIGIQNTRVLTEALVNDVVEYSKHNPAVNPLLIRAGIKPTAQPAAK